MSLILIFQFIAIQYYDSPLFDLEMAWHGQEPAEDRNGSGPTPGYLRLSFLFVGEKYKPIYILKQ